MTAQLVLFACTHNKGRSQMASALFNQLADPAKARSISAGLEPVERVQDEVVEVMREVGIDLSDVRPIELTGRMLTELDFLVTLGCPERCPTIPLSRRQDWRLQDPTARSIEDVRVIRDEIRKLVTELLHEKGWARATPQRPQLVPTLSGDDSMRPLRPSPVLPDRRTK
jgi:arsenate reductase